AVVPAPKVILLPYEGSIKELTSDDHGVALVVVFGLPPLSHADDAFRAVQAALQIQERLQGMGLRHGIGIATGRAFCGVVGNERRRQLAIIGDAMILAARLMQTSPGSIWCDETTYQATRGRLGFTPLAAVTIKGRTEPLPVYVPLGVLASRPHTSRLVGRQHELQRLSHLLESLIIGHRGSLCVIEGEPGIGKTRIMQAFAGLATARGATCLAGNADPYDQIVPYRSWRQIIAQLFSLDMTQTPERQRQTVIARLRPLGDRESLAPLLNAVLPLHFPENDRTQPMSGKLRGEQLRDLLIALLEREAQSRPLVLLLEDLHWMDAASWALLGHYCRNTPSAMILMSIRFQGETGPVAFVQLRNEPRCQRLLLGPLAESEVAQLAADQLGVAELPPAVARFIYQRAEGHPLFSEEVANSLRDAGLLVNRAGLCQWQGSTLALANLEVPTTVAGVITNRVDRLTPSQQLTLKVASVIGRRFGFRQLQDIFPMTAQRERLQEHLDALRREDLIAYGPFAGEVTFQFKHAITHDVVYGLMLFEQRQQLHTATALWLEAHHADDLATHYPALAHHWGRAGDSLKTVHFLDLAGEQALQRGASTEAVTAFSEASRLSHQLGLHPARQRQAHRERLLGRAHLESGHLPEARLHLEQALALMGLSVPQGHGRLLLSLTRAAFIQLWRQVRPARRARRADRLAALTAALGAYEDLREVYLFSNMMPQFLYVGLQGLNAAERTGLTGEMARAYASVCVQAAHMGLRRLALGYATRAAAQMRLADDPSRNLAAMILLGSFHICRGDWALAKPTLETALHTSHRLGDRKQWGYGMALLALGYRHRGDVAQSIDLLQQLLDMAVKHQDIQQQALCLTGLAQSRFRLGQLDVARQLLAEADPCFAASHDQLHALNHRAVRAILHLRGGDYDQARRLSDDLIRELQAKPARMIATITCHLLLAEISLSLWETAPPSTRPGRYSDEERAQLACAGLTAYARLFALALPAAYMSRGQCDWLKGHQARARQCWQLGLESALQLSATFDQARLHEQIGRHLPDHDPARQAHLERSQSLFQELGLPSPGSGQLGQGFAGPIPAPPN
ncbi:MAG: AAA family ATPase, partial [Candidatus Sericytochromatia bacterium]|nr:AAA family ATPase [Candidatus Sericytochromatia bacterium]